MSSDVVISVERLGKRYRIRHQAERQRYTALRDLLADRTKSAARRLWSAFRAPSPSHGERRGEVPAAAEAENPLPSDGRGIKGEGLPSGSPLVPSSLGP